ncbi:MAG: hypothetical protein WCC31_12285 [Terracidiphilus sp.]
MESFVCKLRIRKIEQQLELCQHICEASAREFDTATLTALQWAAVAHRWDEALKASHVLQLTIDLLKRQEREERDEAESLAPNG